MYYFVFRNCVGCRALDENHVYVLRWIGRCLNVLNSAINPVIYSAVNARYRRALVSAISCTLKKRRLTEPSTSTPTLAFSTAKTAVTTTRM